MRVRVGVSVRVRVCVCVCVFGMTSLLLCCIKQLCLTFIFEIRPFGLAPPLCGLIHVIRWQLKRKELALKKIFMKSSIYLEHLHHYTEHLNHTYDRFTVHCVKTLPG